MPRLVFCAAVLAAPLLLARGEALAEQTPTPSVTVFMDFDAKPTNSSVEVMKKEVDDLLKPAGVHLDWRLTRENDGKGSFRGLVVLKFRGRCQVQSWTESSDTAFGAAAATTQTLGFTEVANGRVLPFSEVECDQVRGALSYLRPGADQIERQRALGLALGRVVAHELYHILARTTGHAATGLAKAAQPLRDLISPGILGFLDKDSDAIRMGFRAN